MAHQVPRARRWFRILSERSMVGLIYLCGVSSIIFVFSIFFFVFREGAPFLWDVLDFRGFFLRTGTFCEDILGSSAIRLRI